jgi:hypothetical protein
MPFGVCKMFTGKNLVSSHLIPRKVYEYCNQKGHNPIVLADDVLISLEEGMSVAGCAPCGRPPGRLLI